jgi:hypothetical protein
MEFELTLARSTRLVVSAIVYPGWHLELDGHRVHSGTFDVGRRPLFPEVTVPAGRHTLSYGWSGWPA